MTYLYFLSVQIDQQALVWGPLDGVGVGVGGRGVGGEEGLCL